MCSMDRKLLSLGPVSCHQIVPGLVQRGVGFGGEEAESSSAGRVVVPVSAKRAIRQHLVVQGEPPFHRRRPSGATR